MFQVCVAVTYFPRTAGDSPTTHREASVNSHKRHPVIQSDFNAHMDKTCPPTNESCLSCAEQIHAQKPTPSPSASSSPLHKHIHTHRANAHERRLSRMQTDTPKNHLHTHCNLPSFGRPRCNLPLPPSPHPPAISWVRPRVLVDSVSRACFGVHPFHQHRCFRCLCRTTGNAQGSIAQPSMQRLCQCRRHAVT